MPFSNLRQTHPGGIEPRPPVWIANIPHCATSHSIADKACSQLPILNLVVLFLTLSVVGNNEDVLNP